MQSQFGEEGVEEVVPPTWEEEEAEPGEGVEIAESTIGRAASIEEPIRNENEDKSQWAINSRAKKKEISPNCPRPPRTMLLSEQEKDLLQSRFGQTICDKCVMGPHHCVWSFTGSLWVCERCYSKKSRCSTKGLVL